MFHKLAPSPVVSADCIFPTVNVHPHCAEQRRSYLWTQSPLSLPLCNSGPLLLNMMHAGWAPLPSISLLFHSPILLFLYPSLSDPNPPLHLLVRWKIGETLFSPFPITQNRPGLLKWPFLHLPIGIKPRICPWKSFWNLKNIFFPPHVIIKLLSLTGKCLTFCVYLWFTSRPVTL